MALSWSSSLFNLPLNKSANPQVSHPMSTEAHQSVYPPKGCLCMNERMDFSQWTRFLWTT